ncbi:MAG: non-ribosomal peptide synthetase, partial [Myxococcales bacterium]|nr:non-ribosomal peptide synthetase [Myxococcales bacterium]
MTLATVALTVAAAIVGVPLILAALLASVVTGLIVVQRVGAARRMRRWPAPPLLGPSWPCDYIDKGGLAITDAARGCSGTPTWLLVVRGALDAEHVRRALADVVTRYPSLATKVQPLDGPPLAATRFRYAHDPAFTVEQIFEAIDLRSDPSALPALAQALQNRPLDLFTDPPLTLTLVRTADDGCRLFFRQHHAIADGRAFIGLLADFAAFLDAARAGRRPPPEALTPIHRRGELEPLSLTPLRRVGWRLGGYANLVRRIFRALVRPILPLLQNRNNDYTGDNGTVHWILGDDVLPSWNAARKRIGVSLNSLLTAALFCANQRWHRARGVPVGRTSSTLIM